MLARFVPVRAGGALMRRQQEGHIRRHLRQQRRKQDVKRQKDGREAQPYRRSRPNQHDRIAIEFQAEDIRNCIYGNLQNLGVISAFMCALAGNIYVEPVEESECYKSNGLVAMFWLEWVSIGMFFLSISMTFILANDINAVPNSLLLVHLRRTEYLHAIPGALTSIGLFLMAAGYGVDIDMRTNCRYSHLGVVAAPLFPAAVGGMAWFVKRCRIRLNEFAVNAGHREDMTFGNTWFTTWRERCLPNDVEEVEGEMYLDTLCPHCTPLEVKTSLSEQRMGILQSSKNDVINLVNLDQQATNED